MFHLMMSDSSLSVSMFREFRRRIWRLVDTRYQLGQVFTAF